MLCSTLRCSFLLLYLADDGNNTRLARPGSVPLYNECFRCAQRSAKRECPLIGISSTPVAWELDSHGEVCSCHTLPIRLAGHW